VQGSELDAAFMPHLKVAVSPGETAEIQTDTPKTHLENRLGRPFPPHFPALEPKWSKMVNKSGNLFIQSIVFSSI
jgi:hypothetical protein